MATIRRFEDLEAWQKARELTRVIYEVSGKGAFLRDAGLREQIRRASVSVMSNLAEGFARGGNREFRQFCSLANGSASEVQSCLYAALDAGHLTRDQFNSLSTQAVETGRLVGGLVRYLASNRWRGSKFKREAPRSADVEFVSIENPNESSLPEFDQ